MTSLRTLKLYHQATCQNVAKYFGFWVCIQVSVQIQVLDSGFAAGMEQSLNQDLDAGFGSDFGPISTIRDAIKPAFLGVRWDKSSEIMGLAPHN